MESSQVSQPPQTNSSIKRPHVSHTAIEWYLEKCGEFYRRRYLDKEPVPPTAAMHKGSSVHSGAEENFKQKITSRQDLSSSKIQEITAAAFETRVKAEGVLLTSKEETIGYQRVLGQAKDRAVILADIYAREVAPQHQPVMVEQLQRIRLNDEYDLLVKLDMINDLRQIEDLKNRKRAMSQKEINDSLQFPIYGLAYRALTKTDPAGVVVDNLVDAPVNPKHVRITRPLGMADYQKAVDKINLFLFGVKSAVFMPAPKGSWYCDEDHCGYARTCKFYQYYKRGGGKQQLPFWMKFKKKKKPEGDKTT